VAHQRKKERMLNKQKGFKKKSSTFTWSIQPYVSGKELGRPTSYPIA